jgi:hypothetical protein
MSKYDKIKERVDTECEIIDLQIALKYMDIDQNYDFEGEDIRPEEDILKEIDDLAQKRDEFRKSLQLYCKCDYDHISKENGDKTEEFCSNCLKLCKVITYTKK